MATKITRDEWLKALGEAVKPCDPDAMTVAELSERYSIGRQAAYNKLQELLKKKKARQTWKLVKNRRVIAYVLI